MRIIIRIQNEPLSLDRVLADIGQHGNSIDHHVGALVTFSGIVRADEAGRTITHLNYEHYAQMAEREMNALAEKAATQWPLRAMALVHRVGPVATGEPSVIVAVSAGHRDEAFVAARFLIDELKSKVPIWKSAVGGETK